jgi:hypothetical protein
MSYLPLGVVTDWNDPNFDPNLLTPEQWQQSQIQAAAAAAATAASSKGSPSLLMPVLVVGAVLLGSYLIYKKG